MRDGLHMKKRDSDSLVWFKKLLKLAFIGRGRRLYKSLKKSGCRLDKNFDLLVFCEQPSHWQNVAHIVSAVIERYPNLTILLVSSYEEGVYLEASYPLNCETIHGVSYDMLENFRSRVLLTAMVGFPGELRPKNSIVVHALVSFTGLDGVYTASMFYGYDYILCAGPHHLEDFKRWSANFPQLRDKTLIAAGYPKLDLLFKELEHRPRCKGTAKKTVVYAPTHVYAVNEKLASLRKHGREIVSHLLSLGYRVIFRPHPVSFNDSDRFLVDEIACAHSGNPDFELDASREYFSAYSKADVMVTDLSGTGFTFSFTFTKPAIFFVEDRQAESQLTGLQFEEREKIGFVARSVEDLEMALKNIDTIDWSAKIREYRAVKVFNLGSSGEYAAESISKILCRQKSDDWVSI